MPFFIKKIFSKKTAKKQNNEVFKTKKTNGFSKAFSKRETRVFGLGDDGIPSVGKDVYGHFRGKKTWKKRAKKPHQKTFERSVPFRYNGDGRKVFHSTYSKSRGRIFL